MSFVLGGWASWPRPRASRRMRVGARGMRYGRSFVRIVELSCGFNELALIHGFWNLVIALRGAFFCLIEDDRFSIRRILSESQWRLGTMLSAGGFPAYQMVFGPNPVVFFVGRAIMRTCCLRRIRPSRVSLRDNGSFACEHKKRPLRKWKIVNFAVFLYTATHLCVRI